jgi:hypothetical protein
MIKIGFLFIGLFVLVSCGAQLKTERGLDIDIVNTSTGEIMKLDRQEQPIDCLSDNTLRTKTYNNHDYNVVDFTYPHSIVNKVYLGGKKEIFRSTIGRRSGLGENDYGRTFKPCFGFDYSGFRSYQSAAVNTLFSFSEVEKAKKKGMLPAGISKITLRVGTNVQHIRERSEDGTIIRGVEDLINNAFYSYGTKEVTYVPQGIPHTGISAFSSIAMWDIPFVGVHEYGHHIFSHLVPNYINDKTASSHSRLCFDKGNHNFKKSRKGKASANDAMRALNEGMADLFARYVLDKKITLKGITCLEQTRDVDSKKFANGLPKKMTQSAFRSFLSEKGPQGINCMRTVNFQDPHMVGAIVANTFYELLKRNQLSKAEKLNFIYNYLRKINAQYFYLKNLNAQSALEKMIYIGIEQSRSIVGLSKKEKCGFVARHFPTLHHYYSCK